MSKKRAPKHVFAPVVSDLQQAVDDMIRLLASDRPALASALREQSSWIRRTQRR